MRTKAKHESEPIEASTAVECVTVDVGFSVEPTVATERATAADSAVHVRRPKYEAQRLEWYREVAREREEKTAELAALARLA